MRHALSLGPFYPGWPGVLQLKLEVEEGIVRAAESVVPRSAWLQAEAWDGLSLEEGRVGVEHVCALSSWAYTLAYSQALEALAGIEPPPRARYLRVLMAELERIIHHLLAATKFLRLAGLPTMATALLSLWETMIQARQLLAGRRFFPDLNVPGGLRQDLTGLEALSPLIGRTRTALYRLSQRVLANRTIVASLVGAGLLTKEQAEEEGVGGPVARASAAERDLRRDQPYAAYADLDPQMVTQTGGDAFCRWIVLLLDIFESMRLIEEVIATAPPGAVREEAEIPPGEAQARVETPTGPLVLRVLVEAIEDGQKVLHLARLWRTAPSQAHQAVMAKTLSGQPLEAIGPIVASWILCPACLAR